MYRSTLTIAVAILTTATAFQLGTPTVSAADKFPDTPAGKLVAADGVLIIGHRGNAAFAPENTLASFRSALKAGANVVELDYMVTRDGEQVVFHDKNLDRTTDAPQVLKQKKLAIGDVTWEQLQRLDAGVWRDPRFRGEKIPTLSAALDLIQHDRVTMIERKTGGAAACVKLLREKKMLDKVVIQAFDWDYITEFRRLAPEAVLGTLGGDELTTAKLDAMEKTGAQLVGWNQDITPANIKAIHDRGMKVWIYTVNSPQGAENLIGAGVDGIISDDPATMVEVRNRLRK